MPDHPLKVNEDLVSARDCLDCAALAPAEAVAEWARELLALRTFVRDLAEHGTRFDTTPTVHADAGRRADQLADYVDRIDRSIRDRAAAVLNTPACLTAGVKPTAKSHRAWLAANEETEPAPAPRSEAAQR